MKIIIQLFLILSLMSFFTCETDLEEIDYNNPFDRLGSNYCSASAVAVDHLALNPTLSSVQKNACTTNSPFKVERQDISNIPVVSNTALTVNLEAISPSGTNTFYSDSSCTRAITTIDIPACSALSPEIYFLTTEISPNSVSIIISGSGISGTSIDIPVN